MLGEREELKKYPERKKMVLKIRAEKLKQIKAHANAIAELLYEETDLKQVETLNNLSKILVECRSPF